MSNKELSSRRDFLKYAALGGVALGSGIVSACAKQPPAAEQTPGAPSQTPVTVATTGDILERILREKKMNVAVVIYPPDTFKEGDELKGIFIEAAKWLAGQMGVELNFVEAAFGTFVAAIQTGRADVAIASTFATVARALAVDFTRAIYYLGYSALVRKEDVNKWKSIEDGDKPGVRFVEREGTPCHKWCVDNLKNAQLISLAADADPTQMALEVMAGRADIYIEDDWLVKRLVAEHSDKLSEMPTYTEKPWKLNRVAWAVPKGQASLLNLMNVAIDYLVANEMLQNWTVQFGGHALYAKEAYYAPK